MSRLLARSAPAAPRYRRKNGRIGVYCGSERAQQGLLRGRGPYMSSFPHCSFPSSFPVAFRLMGVQLSVQLSGCPAFRRSFPRSRSPRRPSTSGGTGALNTAETTAIGQFGGGEPTAPLVMDDLSLILKPSRPKRP